MFRRISLPPKYRYVFTTQHCVVSQETRVFVSIALRTSVIIDEWNGCCFLQTITSRFVSDVFASRTFESGDGPSGFTEERNFLTFEF